MTRRTSQRTGRGGARLSSVAAVLGVVVAAGLTLPGCFTSDAFRDEDDREPEPLVRTTVINDSDVTIRVSLHAGDRVRVRSVPIDPHRDGRPVEIVRGGSQPVSIERPRSGFWSNKSNDEQLVFWLRAEVITASWDDDTVHWFELLGPSAKLIRVSSTPKSQGADLRASAADVPIAPVDPRLWPVGDKNYAFRSAQGEE